MLGYTLHDSPLVGMRGILKPKMVPTADMVRVNATERNLPHMQCKHSFFLGRLVAMTQSRKFESGENHIDFAAWMFELHLLC